jgi:LacI family transcriptional regulator
MVQKSGITEIRRMKSISDVARYAKVSLGTVSRVMNHKSDVDAKLRKRVFLASRKLGFIPKVQHRCVAVIAGRVSPFSPIGYVTMLVSLLAKYLAQYKYSMELIDVENLDLAYQAHIQGVIGIIFDDRILALREIPNLPVLTMNFPLKEYGFHSVCCDHDEQMRLAMEHLLANNHRRIAYLENSNVPWGAKRRLAGYRDTLEKAGVEFDPSLVCYMAGKPIYDTLVRLLRKDITAILNFSEDYCLETVHLLTNILKVRIPEDVSVVTMENLPVFQYLSPPHTVIVQPFEELARTAVETMIGLCDREENKSGQVADIVLSNRLVERDSVCKK